MKAEAFKAGLLVLAFALCGCGGRTAPPAPEAPTYTVSGRVIAPYGTDARFGERLIEESDGLDLDGIPFSGAIVAISGLAISATTDSMGFFTLEGVPGGKEATLTATKDGLSFFKALPALSADKLVNVNYQTSAAAMTYQIWKADMPDGLNVEWLEDTIAGNYSLSAIANVYRDKAREFAAGATATPPHQDAEILDFLTNPGELRFIPPYLKSLVFSPNPVKAGQTVTVEAAICGQSKIALSQLVLQSENDEKTFDATLPTDQAMDLILLNEQSEYESGEFFRTITLTATIPAGIREGDYSLNRARIYGAKSQHYYTEAGELALSSRLYLPFEFDGLTVENDSPDETPPELISASFSKSAIDSATDSVELTIEARDLDSELVSAEISLLRPSGGAFGFTVAIADTDFNAASGTYEIKKEFSGISYGPDDSGDYTVASILLRDAANNFVEAEPAGLTFTVSISEPSPAMALESFSISQPYANQPAVLKISATATYAGDKGFLYGSGFLAAESDGSLQSIQNGFWSLSFELNESSGKWDAEATLYLNDFLSGLTIALGSASLSDGDNAVSYSCRDAGACDGIAISPAILAEHARKDVAAPALTAFSLGSATVEKGGKLAASLSISESGSGLKEASLYFSPSGNECDGKDSLNVSVDQFSYKGGGTWEMTFGIPIPERMCAGVWNVIFIGFKDFADNSETLLYTEIEEISPGSTEFTIQQSSR